MLKWPTRGLVVTYDLNVVMTYKDLKIRQGWTLEQKIDHTVGTIEDFLSKTDGKGYISFSGGKDSTVLLDIARRFVRRDLPAVFSNTGNEFPETVQFVHSLHNITIIRPKIRIPDVLAKYGFPLVSKEQSQYISGRHVTLTAKCYAISGYTENLDEMGRSKGK
jgi:3'-phosphoadenosine 5'-phosphosulfate sulfotransferase (PAPS reductase)/FAD synthetase